MVYEVLCADGDGMPFKWRGIRSKLVSTGYIAYPTATDITINFQEPEFGPSHTQTFTTVASPAADDELPDSLTGFGTALEYWQEIASIIQAHPAIAPYLTIYAEDAGTGIALWVVATEYNPDWTVEIAIGSVPNFATTDYTTLLTTFPSNYRLHADVWVEDSYGGTAQKVATLEGIPGADSRVRFDVAKILHDAIRNTFANPSLPIFDSTDAQILDILRNYYLRIWENIGEVSATYDNYLETTPKEVLYGGISQSSFAAGDLFDNLDAANSLLSWYPDRKTVAITQPEWLPWYNYTDAAINPGLEVMYFYEDGTSFTQRNYEIDPITESHQVCLIPVGPPALDPVKLEDCVKYKVRVITINEELMTVYHSQARTYFIDRGYARNRFLMYLNAFHAPITLRCTGDLEEDLEVDREVSQRVLAPGFLPTIDENFQYAESWENIFTYNTGYLTKLEAKALSELLIFSRLFEVSTYGYIPLQLRGKKFAITSDRQNLHAYAIECTPALLARHYSNILIPITAEQDAWLTDLGEYWQTALALPWETP